MSAPCVTSSYLYLSEWPQPFPASSKRNSILVQERFSRTRGSCGARLRRRDISDTGPAHRCSDWCAITRALRWRSRTAADGRPSRAT
jgi:hypothetical protein